MLTSRPRRTACAVALAFLATSAGAASRDEGTVTRESGQGLHTARLETPRGSIQVYLPDDLAAGDTISGTVSYTPSGRTEAEREKNLGELRGYVVDVADEPVPSADGPTWTRVLPELPGPTVVRFRTPRGAPVGEAPIPTAPPVESPPPGLGEALPTLEIPTFGQAGHPVEIGGPFAGDAGATGITIGGHEAPFLAQSPRKTLARVPTEVVGPTDLRIDHDGEVVEAPFRVLAVSLSADKLNLQRGERTRLHLEVSGLEGLDEPIPLTLTNRSPQVIRLGEGEVEPVTIQPGDVTPGGTYRLERPIQSLRTGGFAINATAVPSRRTEVQVQAQGSSPDDCRCERISIRGATTKPSSKLNQSKKEIAVTLPFNVALFCAGTKGGCNGSVKPTADGAALGDWRDDGKAGNGRPQPVADADLPAIRLKEVKDLEVTGKCPPKEDRAVSQKPGTVEAILDLKDRGSVTTYSGWLDLNLSSTCGTGDPSETRLRVYLDKGSTSGVVERLSDLDGNGTPDWFEPPSRPEPPATPTPAPPSCQCERASPSLKDKASGSYEKEGRVTTIEVTLPYEVELTCAKSSDKGAVCSVAATAALAGDGWTTLSGNEASRLGQSLWPAAIPCSGKCDGKRATTSGNLTYRVALLRTNDTPVKGRVEITLTAPCNGSPAETTYTVEIDTSATALKVTVKPR